MTIEIHEAIDLTENLNTAVIEGRIDAAVNLTNTVDSYIEFFSGLRTMNAEGTVADRLRADVATLIACRDLAVVGELG
jgi:hypothetical protein